MKAYKPSYRIKYEESDANFTHMNFYTENGVVYVTTDKEQAEHKAKALNDANALARTSEPYRTYWVTNR